MSAFNFDTTKKGDTTKRTTKKYLPCKGTEITKAKKKRTPRRQMKNVLVTIKSFLCAFCSRFVLTGLRPQWGLCGSSSKKVASWKEKECETLLYRYRAKQQWLRGFVLDISWQIMPGDIWIITVFYISWH